MNFRKKNNDKTSTVFIISKHKFQSELLSIFLQRETGLTCIIKSQSDLTSHIVERQKSTVLTLMDCLGKKFDDLWSELFIRTHCRKINCYLALFNLKYSQNIEVEAINRGIRGVFFQHSEADLLAKGVKAIFRGELWYSRECLFNYLKNNHTYVKNQAFETGQLTRKENQILLHISSGKTSSQIADILFISKYTVKTHTRNIYRKIGVKNRFEALRWTIRNI